MERDAKFDSNFANETVQIDIIPDDDVPRHWEMRLRFRFAFGEMWASYLVGEMHNTSRLAWNTIVDGNGRVTLWTSDGRGEIVANDALTTFIHNEYGDRIAETQIAIPTHDLQPVLRKALERAESMGLSFRGD